MWLRLRLRREARTSPNPILGLIESAFISGRLLKSADRSYIDVDSRPHLRDANRNEIAAGSRNLSGDFKVSFSFPADKYDSAHTSNSVESPKV